MKKIILYSGLMLLTAAINLGTMPEISVINTNTVILTGVSSIDLYTYYIPDGASGLLCFISEGVGTVGSITYIEGHGIIVDSGSIQFSVDTDGHLLVDDPAGDNSRFSLDEMTGHLMEDV